MKWRVIAEFPAYEVSDAGLVRRKDTGHVLALQKKANGYMRVSIWHAGRGAPRYVHRLVCEAFNGPSPLPRMDAAHLDGVRDNNRAHNLAWKSRKENMADCLRHGTHRCGKQIVGAKLDEDKVREMKHRLLSAPRSQSGKYIKKGALREILDEYGVTVSVAHNILHGKSWRHVE